MSHTPTIPGVVLAGGRSRRMGVDKAAVRLGDKPLGRHVIDRLAPQVTAVAVNYAGPKRWCAGYPTIEDPLPGQPGPLAGILAALLWAREAGASHVVTAPVDTPFLPADCVARLAAVDAPVVMAATASDGRCHPTCALWSVALIAPLEAALATGTRRVQAFAETHGGCTAAFPDDAFFNVNTPRDLAEAARRLVG